MSVLPPVRCAARLVFNGYRNVDEARLLQDFLQHASHAVLRAAGRRADDDLDGFLWLPGGLRVHGRGSSAQQRY
jgi:hypothetical protein